jgi:hypothetical protein
MTGQMAKFNPDGEYTLADGMMVTVAGSTVAEIDQKQRK